MNESYGSKDCNLKTIQNDKIVVVGYGIQGRAQALNLRDSGLDVLISNLDDKYKEIAIADKFDVIDFDEACKIADILLLLIPDSAHLEFINKSNASISFLYCAFTRKVGKRKINMKNFCNFIFVM